MRRRHFIAILGGASAVTAAGAWGQAVTRPRRIGFLSASPPPARVLEAFRRGLADRGYVEGRDYLIVNSWGDGRLERLPNLAEALVKAPVEVIVADGTRPAAAAHAASKTIPIVLAGGLDPVRDGLAKSLSRPDGNVTGFTTQVVGLVGKSFEILKETIPGLSRIAIIAPVGVGTVFHAADADASSALGLAVIYVGMTAAPEGADAAMGQATAAHAQAAVLRGTPFLSTAQRRTIVERAAAHRLPIMYETRDFVDLGGLFSYGSEFDDLFRHAADYVVRILDGENPGMLPIQQSSKIELVINMNAAKALGIKIPNTIIVRANDVIE